MNVVKRSVCFVLVIVMLLSLVACEGREDVISGSDSAETDSALFSTDSSSVEGISSESETEVTATESNDTDDSSAELVESSSESSTEVSAESEVESSNDSSEGELSEDSLENSEDVSVIESSETESSEDYEESSNEESEEDGSEDGSVDSSEVSDNKFDENSESSEGSHGSPTDTSEEYPVYSPQVSYKVTYENDGLILYNTDFRMSSELESSFVQLFESFPYAQSICMTELSTNMAFAYQPNKRIATASSIKGPFGLYVTKSVDAGRVSWKDPKSYEEKHYQANSSGGIQYYDYGTSFSVKRLLELMIDISDNQAYLMLKDMLGSKKFNRMMAKLGADTIIPSGGNWGNITGWEMLQTWREIYYYKDVNKNGDMLFDLYLEAAYNYIKDALPQYTSAHKSGWSGKAFNDAGIVFNDNVYAMSILLGRKDVYDTGSQVYFRKVAKLLDKLMNEYNAYLEGDNGETESTASAENSESVESSEDGMSEEESLEMSESSHASQESSAVDSESEATFEESEAESSEASESESVEPLEGSLEIQGDI